ncbi:fungal-specific transcription factor domain-containing protein [Fomes fomentarius]|nr:fungal-specific transcription factor domain-containing protein [Fomes fomentarius]
MSHQTWPSSSTSYAHSSQYGADRYAISSPVSPVNGQSHHALSLTDEYEDEGGDELGDLPSGGVGGITLAPYGGVAGGSKAGDKQVRRRSSKACDQCRKSKCKCERSSPQDPCRNCVMLGTQCTFLGPSRKRGPPKGYIDAIEARLHQTEALLGILLNSKDSRAKTVLEDLAEDPLAKEIITRVDNSPYGYKGRSRGAEAPSSRSRAPTENREGGAHSVHATHPSNEWQDQVIARLNAAAATRNTLLPGDQVASIDDDADEEDSRPSTASQSAIPASTRPKADPPSIQPANSDSRRQRRRLNNPAQARSPSTTSSHSAHRRVEEESVDDSESGEDEIAIAVGQLSLNEDEQVRYHGKVSGLHLLGANERQDGRGIWRFPKARVWPPLSPAVRNSQRRHSAEFAPRLPDVPTQELLLELYFTYVHPALPIVHKPTFMDDWSKGNLATDSPYSGESGYSDAASPVSSSSPLGARRRRVPTLLLLAMFSLSARYSTRTADVPPPDDGSMWSAGDEYMEDAKVILDRTYAASRPSTCQALLLLGFREVGIGAMAQAWLYLGMAVRMAQDLGLHKCAENWTGIGRNLFSKAELQERRRIWYGCVIMDKYICTYIGRPVAICERDFDTPLPLLEDPEETELWQPHTTPQVMDDPNDIPREVAPMPGHIISCFNESAKLSIIISEICQSIYAIKPTGSRPAELARLDSHLTKWSLELPEHLRFDPASPKNPSPPPHILTLHMQYWCTILLLHRPFIRHIQDSMKAMSPSASSAKEAEIRANSRQHYDMCVQAANHITLIVSVFSDHFSPRRASVFLCYYVFTAAIMHVATLRTYPDDPQAARGLETTMEILRKMSVIWPSAWRALELLLSAKATIDRMSEVPSVRSSFSETRNKRAAEDAIEEDVTVTDRSRMVTQDSQQVSPHQPHYPLNPSQSQSPVQGQPGHTSGQHGYSLSIDAPQSSAPAAYMQPSYDRWPTDGTSSSSLTNFSGSISTSVLPQQYSTGLVDGRIGTSMSRNPERQSQRYPQFWNDYSALGQMETTYSVPVIGEMVSQHQHGSAGHSSAAEQQQGMYVPSDQYPLFGECLVLRSSFER